MPKLSDEEFRIKVAEKVAAGGWTSIAKLVNSIPIEDLRDR